MLWSNHHDWPTWCATNGHCEVNTAVWLSDHSTIPLATIWILRRTVSTFTWRYFEYVIGLHTAPRPSFVVWEYIRTMTGLTYSAHEILWFLARMHFQPFLRHTRFLPVKFDINWEIISFRIFVRWRRGKNWMRRPQTDWLSGYWMKHSAARQHQPNRP